MNSEKTAFIFPAFVNEYLGKEREILSSLSNDFETNLKITSDWLGKDLSNFHEIENNYLDQELLTQYITYTFSCSISDMLQNKEFKPDFITGYSMGIYAAIYSAKSIDFIAGLEIIKMAYHEMQAFLGDKEFGMGIVIGLSVNDIQLHLKSSTTDVELINANAEFSHVISGEFNEIVKMLDIFKEEGALNTKLLKVSSPYHSKYVIEAAKNIGKRIQEFTINTPVFPVISLIDQKTILNSEDVAAEISRNIDHSLDWYKTMQFLIAHKATTIFECGAGNGLYKNGKFVDGDFQIYPITKYSKLF
jgi:malonyl CoA-acyl carrier protein transacylase